MASRYQKKIASFRSYGTLALGAALHAPWPCKASQPSWDSASTLGHRVDPMRRVRPTTALEKYEEGCGSVTHVTGEPLKMFIGTRAPSSSVSSTETKRRGASHVRRALAMRPCLVSELTDITTRSVRGHGALGWAYSAITRSKGSHATGILDSLRIEQAIL